MATRKCGTLQLVRTFDSEKESIHSHSLNDVASCFATEALHRTLALSLSVSFHLLELLLGLRSFLGSKLSATYAFKSPPCCCEPPLVWGLAPTSGRYTSLLVLFSASSCGGQLEQESSSQLPEAQVGGGKSSFRCSLREDGLRPPLLECVLCAP